MSKLKHNIEDQAHERGPKHQTLTITWSDAIGDAEADIRRMERRIAGLKASIQIFRERLKSGAPFPIDGL